MIVLWIILGVLAALIAIIVILLHISVRVYIEADNNRLDVKVKYLGFELYKLSLPDKSETESDKPPEGIAPKTESSEIELCEIPEVDSTVGEKVDSEPEPQPEKEPDEPEKTEEKAEEKTDGGPSLLDKFNAVKKYIPAGKKAFRKLLKLIRFYGLRLELTVGNDDPYKAGLNFGRINAVAYSVLGLLCCLFSVKIEHAEIKCDFEKKVTEFYAKTAIYVRPSAVLALAAYVGIYYLKIRKSLKKLDDSKKETAKNE